MSEKCQGCRTRLVVTMTLLAGVSVMLWQSTQRLEETSKALRVAEEAQRTLERDLIVARMEARTRTEDVLLRLLDVRYAPVREEAQTKDAGVPRIPESLRKLAGVRKPPSRESRASRKAKGSPSKSVAKKSPSKEADSPSFTALGVREGRLYYRAPDGVIHVASPGDYLHGINGRYKGFDEKKGVARLLLGSHEIELKPDRKA